jgi:trimeric autotransporter adhesin
MAIRKIVARSIGVDVITAEDLADNSITAAEITNGAVTADKLASNSVTTAKITDANVTTGKLATDLVVTHALGSASTPSITFTGDTNTGIFSPAADTIAFAEGGVESMRIDSDGDVGIGATSISRKLQISQSNATTYTGDFDAAPNQLYIVNTNTTTNAYTGLQMDVGSNSQTAISAIRTGDGEVAMAFGTRVAGVRAERMRIDASGNVGIGTDSPTQKLSIAGNITLTQGINRRLDIGSASNYTYSVMMSGDDFQIREAVDDNKVRLRIKYSATASLAGQLQLPIDGGATLYNAYTCRAWVSFNGTGTVAIRGSGNVSSITDLNTGSYRVNFITSMPNANYAVALASEAGGGSGNKGPYLSNPLTGSVQVFIYDSGGALVDAVPVNVAIFL